MGGGNVMQEHHRRQRKKEMQKNKQQRLKARDERVLNTKSVSSVQEEIKKLKIRKNLQPTEKQKLQRLEKELKMLKEAQSKQPKSHWKPQQNRSAPQLDDPRKSVYFDAQFNPYGAPPPGKPRLYHRRGGGVTMNINEAIVPGEEPPPPTTQQNPRQTNDQRGHFHGRGGSQTDEKSSSLTIRDTQFQSTRPSEEEAKDNDTKEEEEKKKPLTVPSLPPPSKAVERGRRGKLNADIWASTEEVDYELRANQVDLEADNIGEVKKKTAKKKKKKPPLEFYYQDMSGQVQGPYQKAQMREWMNAGFFPPSTMVKTSRKETWLPIGDVQALEETSVPTASTDQSSVSDRIAALKGENSVQDRIAALRAENSAGGEDDKGKMNDIPAEFEDRIAALRKSLGAKASKEASSASGNEPTPEDPVPEYSPPDDVYEEEQPTFPAHPPDDVYDGEQEIGSVYPPPDDVYDGEQEAGPAYPPPDDAPAYPLDEQVVAPYPVDDSHEEDSDQPPYPTHDGPSVAPYPAVDEYPRDVPYPANDAYPTDTAYPADDAYPVSEGDVAYPVTDAYPAVESYPAMDADGGIQGPQMGPPAQPSKKIVKVDKAVVGFVPSHLRNPKRKPTATAPPQGLPKRAKMEAITDKGGAKDELDKFMDEIDGL